MPIIDNGNMPHTIQARLVSERGEEAGPPIDLPVGVTVAQLGLICNALLQNVLKYIFPKNTKLNKFFISGRTNTILVFRE